MLIPQVFIIKTSVQRCYFSNAFTASYNTIKPSPTRIRHGTDSRKIMPGGVLKNP